MVLTADFFHTFIHLICCKCFQNWRRTSRAPFSKCPPVFTALSLRNWEGNIQPGWTPILSFGFCKIRLYADACLIIRLCWVSAPKRESRRLKTTGDVPHRAWRLRYSDSAQIFQWLEEWGCGRGGLLHSELLSWLNGTDSRVVRCTWTNVICMDWVFATCKVQLQGLKACRRRQIYYC